MADRIKILPDAVANQIAAGEVVNRPSSVVKELLENAVDAGSKNITVNFKDGGKMLIQVVDDGCGMTPMDARMAFDRHATSKIDKVDDIYQLATFGFRGEALASIASIAEVELRSRQGESELGTKIEICGGKFISQEPVSMSVGSQFIVKNLFYNVPARRRFLEKSTTEARQITAEYQRVALCNPQVGFTLYDNDALISKLPPTTLRQRIVGVIGRNIAKNLLELNADTSIVKVDGYVGRPAGAKQNNREQFLFVNGRYFRSPYLHKAVIAAYEKLIPNNTQPSYFIYLTIDPELIDVNVHPQKTEIKFTGGSSVWQIINAAVRETLAKSGAVPPMDFDIDNSVEIPVIRERVLYDSPKIRGNPVFNPFETEDSREEHHLEDELNSFFSQTRGGGREEIGSSQAVTTMESGMRLDTSYEDEYESSVLEFVGGERYSQGRLEVGVATKCGDILPIGREYFATVINGVLVVVDIRRAYESVLYDRYVRMLTNRSSACQQLLFAESLTMSIDDITLLKEHLDDFVAFGFDIKMMDHHTVEIVGLPADFTSIATGELIYELLDTLRDEVGSASDVRRTRLAATMSRLGATSRIRAMSGEELVSLMEQLSASSNPSFTPTGNPTMFTLSEEDIYKRLQPPRK